MERSQVLSEIWPHSKILSQSEQPKHYASEPVFEGSSISELIMPYFLGFTAATTNKVQKN